MKFYFIRHGKTLWNLEGRFQGASGDSPLLEESIETLKKLGQYLQETPFDVIYSSDLPRAKTSAQIIQSGNSGNLKEQNLQPWKPSIPSN